MHQTTFKFRSYKHANLDRCSVCKPVSSGLLRLRLRVEGGLDTTLPLLSTTGLRSLQWILGCPHLAGRHPAITQVQVQKLGKEGRFSLVNLLQNDGTATWLPLSPGCFNTHTLVQMLTKLGLSQHAASITSNVIGLASNRIPFFSQWVFLQCSHLGHPSPAALRPADVHTQPETPPKSSETSAFASSAEIARAAACCSQPPQVMWWISVWPVIRLSFRQPQKLEHDSCRCLNLVCTWTGCLDLAFPLRTASSFILTTHSHSCAQDESHNHIQRIQARTWKSTHLFHVTASRCREARPALRYLAAPSIHTHSRAALPRVGLLFLSLSHTSLPRLPCLWSERVSAPGLSASPGPGPEKVSTSEAHPLNEHGPLPQLTTWPFT